MGQLNSNLNSVNEAVSLDPELLQSQAELNSIALDSNERVNPLSLRLSSWENLSAQIEGDIKESIVSRADIPTKPVMLNRIRQQIDFSLNNSLSAEKELWKESLLATKSSEKKLMDYFSRLTFISDNRRPAKEQEETILKFVETALAGVSDLKSLFPPELVNLESPNPTLQQIVVSALLWACKSKSSRVFLQCCVHLSALNLDPKSFPKIESTLEHSHFSAIRLPIMVCKNPSCAGVVMFPRCPTHRSILSLPIFSKIPGEPDTNSLFSKSTSSHGVLRRFLARFIARGSQVFDVV